MIGRKCLLALAVAGLLGSGALAGDNFQIGVGANYWLALKNAVDDSFDKRGLGWMISSRYMATPVFGFGLDVERSPKNYIQFEKPIYSPAAYIIVGKGIYAALGIGTYYYDGKFVKDTFYAARAGLTMELIPRIVIDINANYRSEEWSKIKKVHREVSTDNVVMGAAIRVKF